MGSLPFLAVEMKPMEKDCELVSFASSKIANVGILSEFIEACGRCWALESQSLADNPVQEFKVCCFLKRNILLQVLEQLFTNLTLLCRNFCVLISHLLQALRRLCQVANHGLRCVLGCLYCGTKEVTELVNDEVIGEDIRILKHQ